MIGEEEENPLHPNANRPADVPVTKRTTPPDDFSLVEGTIVCTSCHAPHCEANVFLLRRYGNNLC